MHSEVSLVSGVDRPLIGFCGNVNGNIYSPASFLGSGRGGGRLPYGDQLPSSFWSEDVKVRTYSGFFVVNVGCS